MTNISPTTTDHRFNVGPGFWAMLPADTVDSVLQRYVDCALFLILNERLPCPDKLRLELMCKLGAEAETMFFCAALDQPTRRERRRFFQDFVRRALNSGRMDVFSS